MTIKPIVLLLAAAMLPVGAEARKSAYDKAREKQEKRYEKAKKQATKRYENLRDQANRNYIKALEKAWKRYERNAPVARPVEPPVPPVVAPPKPEPPIDRPVKVDPVPVAPLPQPAPQPEPIAPPQPPVEPIATYQFTWLGTPLEVRRPADIKMTTSAPDAVAAAWQALSAPEYDAMLEDCLTIRRDRDLCDWAYLSLVSRLASGLYGQGTPAAETLAAWLLSQSGYKVRLATTGKTLRTLFASRHMIYGRTFLIDGNDYLYPLTPTESDEGWYMASADMPGEKTVSLYVSRLPRLTAHAKSPRTLKWAQGNGATATVSGDANLIDFYASYPTSYLDGDHMTRWQQYAMTPLSAGNRPMVETLRKAIAGKSQAEAVGTILNFVQTAFEYEYDDKVWGGDRAFFPDETVYYPYSDCEDRAILFTRLVRDLTGLNAALLYYPGHLAAAVEFTDPVKGDWLTIGGRRFVVCDPTYINAPVGSTMPGMDNATAKAIQL